MLEFHDVISDLPTHVSAHLPQSFQLKWAKVSLSATEVGVKSDVENHAIP